MRTYRPLDQTNSGPDHHTPILNTNVETVITHCSLFSTGSGLGVKKVYLLLLGSDPLEIPE